MNYCVPVWRINKQLIQFKLAIKSKTVHIILLADDQRRRFHHQRRYLITKSQLYTFNDLK